MGRMWQLTVSKLPGALALCCISVFSRGLAMAAGNSGVTIEVRVLKPEATLTSRGAFEVTLRNASDAPVTVYGDLTSGVVFELRGADGKEIVRATHAHELCPPPPPEASDWVRLRPGHGISYVDQRSLQELGLMTSGKYSVRAMYWHVVLEDEEGFHLSLAREPVASSSGRVNVR
jgi:hypothetical protein